MRAATGFGAWVDSSEAGADSRPPISRAVAHVLAATGTPMSLDDLAAHFTARGRWRDRLPQLLDTLAALGGALRDGEQLWRA